MNYMNLNAYPTETIFPFTEAQFVTLTNNGSVPITYNFDASVTATGNVTLQPGQSSTDFRTCTVLHVQSSNGIQPIQLELEREISDQFGDLSKLQSGDKSNLVTAINTLSRSKQSSPSFPYRSADIADIGQVHGYAKASSTAAGYTANAGFSQTNKWRANTTNNGEWLQRHWFRGQRVNRMRVLFGDNYTRIPIFFLHRIDDSVPGDTTTATFTHFIQYAKSKGFQFIKLSQAIEYLRGGNLPNGITKPIVLGADDGYDYLYDRIYPVLQSENVPISLWMLTGWAGQDTRATDPTGHIYVKKSEITTMINSGLLELHTHTHNHHGTSVLGGNYYIAPGVQGHPALGPQYDPTTGTYQSVEDWSQGYIDDMLQSIDIIRSYPNQTHELTFTAPNHIITPHTYATLRSCGIIGQTNISFDNIKNVKGCNLLQLGRTEIDDIGDNTKAESYINAVDYNVSDVTRTISVSVWISDLDNPNATTNSDWNGIVPTTPITDGVMYEQLPRYGVLGGNRDLDVEWVYKGAPESGIKAMRIVCDTAPSGVASEIFQASVWRESTTPAEISRSELLSMLPQTVNAYGPFTWRNYDSGNQTSFEIQDSSGTRQLGVGSTDLLLGANILGITFQGSGQKYINEQSGNKLYLDNGKLEYVLANGLTLYIKGYIFTTAGRPTKPSAGSEIFDSTLGKPVWCKTSAVLDGSQNVTTPAVWVDATGTTV